MFIIQVLRSKLGKANNVTADAAFKSQSKREMINIKHTAKMPAPGNVLFHLSI
jgi:hypothetical protein